MAWQSFLLPAYLCISFAVISYACKLIYLLFFHPFAKIPGPQLARVSWIWSKLSNLEGSRYQRIHNAHRTYGPIVRIGPNELSFADPAVVREIYTSNVFVKEDRFYFAKKVFQEEHLFSFRNPEAHKQRRRLLARGYSQQALLEYEPDLSRKIETLMKIWEDASTGGQVLDVFPWVHRLGFDTVYHLLFGIDPTSLTRKEEHEVLPHLRAWKPTYVYKEFFPQIETLGPYIPGRVGGYFRHVKAWKEYSVRLIQQSREEQASTPFLRAVLAGEKDAYLGRPLTDSELAEECMGGMFGGTGTTANTFIFLLWATLRRPDIVAILKKELFEAIPERTTVPSNQLCATLPWLQAVINETLRLYPTIIATLPRKALQDTVVAGVKIPKGAVVGIQNYTIHRCEAAFPEPEEFRPERWLDDANTLAKEAFMPFSTGNRRCIGINLAQMELLKVVATFFRRFDAVMDASMRPEEMRLFDSFSAGPVGGSLRLRLRPSAT